jgi:hypothetical protein
MATRIHTTNWQTGNNREPLPATAFNVLASCPCPGTPGMLGPDVTQRIIDRLDFCGFTIVEKSSG